MILHIIEKRPEAGVIPPIFAQIVLINSFQIYRDPVHLNVYLFISLTLSLIGYLALIIGKISPFRTNLSKASLLMLYLPTLTTILFTLPINLLQPLSFLLAGVCTLHYVWYLTQSNREIAGIVILGGI